MTHAPPGTRYDDAFTWHGQFRDAGGGLTFLGLFAACLATRTVFARRWGVVCAVVVAVAWIAASAMAVVAFSDASTSLPWGLAERVALFAGLGWLIALALHLANTATGMREP
ncbi:DUF998 domain-containing protein [Pseudonocardia asaccharolytica]|uniref:Uncharacterized protein n=1 Tax=Pseudonocardia asaccharolytica DSM 44247 = NBRC 16224 TaxID=1123024 RepID=A0A511D7I3_9PSEU|nr:DUF998 domain-containing protein [Pseudonocardia asaccharolytica]GEL20769.1 hypothetical protein PA7_46060 [Pseudonocardia asaccharolytica DSM 44247 = NBRC 16224]